MKTRTALLVAFMIIVPAAAMFSHRIPPDIRRTIRERMTRLAAAVQPGTKALGVDPGGVAGGPSAAVEPGVVAPPPAGGVAASPPEPQAAAFGGDDVKGGLARLGAIGFECRPVAGGEGAHVASCSVPLDGSGQLLRVFHVTGADARSAAVALFEDVAAWRDRANVRRAAAEPDGQGARTLRF